VSCDIASDIARKEEWTDIGVKKIVASYFYTFSVHA